MSLWSLLSTSWVCSQRFMDPQSRAAKQQRSWRQFSSSRGQIRLGLELLEDRTLLSASLIDDVDGHDEASLLESGNSSGNLISTDHHHDDSIFAPTTADGKPNPLLDDTFYLAPQYHLHDSDGFLTGRSSDQPLNIALDFIRSHAGDLGLTSNDLINLVVTDQYVSEQNGVTHIYLRQTLNDLEVVNAEINVNISARGQVINVGSSFVAGLYGGNNNSTANPALEAVDALAALASGFGWTFDTAPSVIGSSSRGASQATVLTSGGISLDDVTAELHYVPTSDGGVELAWNFVVRTVDGDHWFEAGVSAEDGDMVYFSDWGGHAQYNVYALPLENPNDGNRTLEVDPADATASPFGWHDTDGIAGAEFTDTRGNNVSAQEDRDDDNMDGHRPDGGTDLAFDFEIDFTQEPESYEDAAITNLFYWNNLLHDIHYQYGFDELSGNFQVNNYGNGGQGGDAVQADAQDGSGFNNANFQTPPDGFAPRMQQYLFTYTTPNRDSSLSNSIVIHEYGHGVTNRLTGGPGNSGALNAIQSGGMGEGWSDFWSLMLTQKSSDGQFDSYAVGDYVLDDPAGIRRYPYSFDMSINPLTYDNFNGGFPNNQVHNAGEIWASALWDLNWLLINGDGGDITGYGFDADIYNGTGGNNLTLQLVMDALKLQPANPSFLDARDALLLADQIDNGGANQLAIWTAFARRGMGFSADDGGSGNSTSVVAAFDLPASSEGTVAFDAEAYEVGDMVMITVRDIDLVGSGFVNVDLVSSSGDRETVRLNQMGLGIYEASVATTASSVLNDGMLEVSLGDLITVTYSDNDDGTGSPAVVIDTADIVELVDIFRQDFESGLGTNEELHGSFTINDTNTPLNNGTLMVGHPATHGNFDYSYYEVTLDLRGFEHSSLEFEYAAQIEDFYDGFNLQASTGTINPPGDLISPTSGLPYDAQNPGPIFTPPPEIGLFAYDSGGVLDMGTAVFDISSFDGQIVTIRFQFGSDDSVTRPGINFDNLLVRGSVVQTEPVAQAGGPYVFGNRDMIQLDGSRSFDRNQAADTLTYMWDFDNDGTYDATGIRPYLSIDDLNGQNNAVVRLKVVDDNGDYDTDLTRVYVEDTSVLRIRGDYDGVVGQRRVVSLKLYGKTVTNGQYTYTVDWGDGSKQRVVTGISGLSISKIYKKTGNFTISATAVSNDTGLNTSHSRRIRIGTVQRQGDDFAVTGTNARDEFRVVTLAGTDRVQIYRNRISLGVHTVPGTIYAIGLGGDDWFRGDRGTYDVYFDGGSGNNVSYTYDGNDTILGREGRDRVYNYGGDNYVSVGNGNNVVKTNRGDDYVKSGSGDDTIIDFGGNNRIYAGGGDNDISTRGGNDVIITGSGQDKVTDNGGNNRIEVGNGSNVVRTGDGSDTILGGAQDDSIRDSGGFNFISTFAGNDFIVAGGTNYIDSGLGSDFVYGFNLFDDEDDLFDLLARAR